MSTPRVPRTGAERPRPFAGGPAPGRARAEHDPPARHVVHAQIVDDDDRPIGRARYEVLDASGNVVASGTTGFDGMVRHEIEQPGSYTVRVTELPEAESAQASEPTEPDRGEGAGASGPDE